MTRRLEELRSRVVEMWYAAYHDGMRVARYGGDDGDQLKDVDEIIQLIAQHDIELLAQREQEYFELYRKKAIELLKTFRPARPEDLSISQWYGLVEAIDAGIAELEQYQSKPKETE